MAEETDVVHRPDTQRYEILLDGQVAGYVTYQQAHGHLVLDHTKVKPAFEGRGLAGQLATGTFEDLRSRGLRAEPRCEFMAAWVAKHPEYCDVIVPAENAN